MITSEVKKHGGIPTLFVNGKPRIGLAYITYYTDRNHYRDFSDVGYALYSCPVFFGRQPINEYSDMTPFDDGIFDDEKHPRFELFDKEIRRILSACPDAMIFPRVNTNLSKNWEAAHPAELCYKGVDGRPPRVSFSSECYRETVKKMLGQLIAHVEESDFCDHIVGYQVAGGNTEEWFPFEPSGGDSPQAREKYRRLYGCEPENDTEYFRFLSEEVAETVCGFARAVKELTQNRLVVGTFCGYTFECPPREQLRHSFRTLLRSPYLDFLCAPASYAHTREAGRDIPCMCPMESVMLHGKLYFTEGDIRTYLSKFPKDCRENACVPGTYEQPIWLGPQNPIVSRAQLTAVFASALTRGNALWWFDMWGGYYDDPLIMEQMRAYHEIAAAALADDDRTRDAEIAVFTDDTAFLRLSWGDPLCGNYGNREVFASVGVPFKSYEIADFAAVMDMPQKRDARAVVFYTPVRTDALTIAEQYCETHGIPYQTFLGVAPTTDALSAFYKASGIHIYVDDVFYLSRHYCAVYATKDGEKVISFKKTHRFTPLLSADMPCTGNSLHLRMKRYEARIFRID